MVPTPKVTRQKMVQPPRKRLLATPFYGGLFATGQNTTFCIGRRGEGRAEQQNFVGRVSPGKLISEAEVLRGDEHGHIPRADRSIHESSIPGLIFFAPEVFLGPLLPKRLRLTPSLPMLLRQSQPHFPILAPPV